MILDFGAWPPGLGCCCSLQDDSGHSHSHCNINTNTAVQQLLNCLFGTFLARKENSSKYWSTYHQGWHGIFLSISQWRDMKCVQVFLREPCSSFLQKHSKGKRYNYFSQIWKSLSVSSHLLALNFMIINLHCIDLFESVCRKYCQWTQETQFWMRLRISLFEGSHADLFLRSKPSDAKLDNKKKLIAF